MGENNTFSDPADYISVIDKFITGKLCSRYVVLFCRYFALFQETFSIVQCICMLWQSKIAPMYSHFKCIHSYSRIKILSVNFPSSICSGTCQFFANLSDVYFVDICRVLD